MINVEVIKKGASENDANVIRRFTKRVRNSGILARSRAKRYHTKKVSKYITKKTTLRSIAKKEEIKKLIKLGKMTEKTMR